MHRWDPQLSFKFKLYKSTVSSNTIAIILNDTLSEIGFNKHSIH